ncbi:MAG: hypothetical protein KKB31_08045 [Nanoarchaeota archaeon]|nr:hypothetical protein [Nanoarchaeota archaeon]
MTEPLKRYGGFLHPTHAGGVSAYCTSEDVAALEARVQERKAESEKRRIQLGVQSIGHGQEWMRANEAESKLTITLARVQALEAVLRDIVSEGKLDPEANYVVVQIDEAVWQAARQFVEEMHG